VKTSLLAFIARIIRPFAAAFYAFVKLLRPMRHKITFISRQSDSTPVDFTLLISELAHQDRSLKVQTLCVSDKTRSERFAGHLRATLRELWHIANSSAVVLDGYSLAVSYFPQRKSLFVLQMWHALGAIKRFSWQCVDMTGGRSSQIAQALRMHANYSAVLVGGEASVEDFRHGFRVARSRIHAIPLPRVDILRAPDMNRMDMLMTDNRAFFERTPLILYAPTFRDTPEQAQGQLRDLGQLAEAVAEKNATLIVKTHLRDDLNRDSESSEILNKLARLPHVVMNPEMDILDLVSIVDHVVTDYSSIAFEAAVAGKPVWLYLSDIDKYKESRGLNIDPELYLPKSCYTNAKALVDAHIYAPLPSADQERFLAHFVASPPKESVTSAKQIARLILRSIQ
jgi:CDP-ribitol ribitolphosphotransferase